MLLEKRDYYKPFNYPWAYELWDVHEKLNWHPDEVVLSKDITDWNTKLTAGEKNLLGHLFRFFTQADVDVAGGYVNYFMPLFSGNPEITMMLTSFAAREAVHIAAYSKLLDSLNIPESEYKAFLEYEEMEAKHKYLLNTLNETDQNYFGKVRADGVLPKLAVYSAFTEGLQLFSTFAILLNFQRFNKMKGMCEIVAWSIRDESLHVEGMMRLYQTLREEHPFTRVADNMLEICQTVVGMEDKFIDLCFKEAGEIEGITPEEVKQYIRYIADMRLEQLQCSRHYNVSNPFPWIDGLVNGVEHTNFFEGRATAYGKAALQGDWEDVWAKKE